MFHVYIEAVPKNWTETKKILCGCGYKDPAELHIYLHVCYINQWDVMESPDALCRHCKKEGTITCDYLGSPEKIQHWVEDPVMCKKIMAR